MKLQHDRNALELYRRAGWTHLFAAFAFALLVFALSALATSPASAATWTWKQVYWDTTTSRIGLPQIHIGDEADTNRTKLVDTSDWDWGAFETQVSAKGVPVWFIAKGIVSVADSIYYIPEQGAAGMVGAHANRLGITVSIYNSAATLGGASVNGVYFGYLQVDFDARTAENIYGAKDFRLLVFGDQAGTTPSLSGVECWIRYPKKTSP